MNSMTPVRAAWNIYVDIWQFNRLKQAPFKYTKLNSGVN